MKTVAFCAGKMLLALLLLQACDGGSNTAGSPTAGNGTSPVITTATLPIGAVGQAYMQTLTATGGTTPLTWGLASGSDPLPAGVALDPASGSVQGTPTAVGIAHLVVQVTDGAGKAATTAVTLAISPRTERVSVDSMGAQADGNSFTATLSADGRFVAFDSFASNLVLGDTNGLSDIFVRDRQSGQTSRVSVDNSGAQADRASFTPAISAGGRYVAFVSEASNLVPGDTNGFFDVFLRDLQTSRTMRISVDSAGAEANGRSLKVVINADGRFVAFLSDASNLVPNDTNGTFDVFLHDVSSGQTSRVSVDGSGAQANGMNDYIAISADGRFVTFHSAATNLVPGDTNGSEDVFVHDRVTGNTSRVSVDSTGAQGDALSRFPAISGDGRFVAFASLATNLVAGDANSLEDVFVHDRILGQTIRVSVDSSGGQALGASSFAGLSGDGRFVAFGSGAPNLVPGDTNNLVDVFIHDIQTGQTIRMSVDNSGMQVSDGTGNSFTWMSGDGRFVAFSSDATSLVPGDTNGVSDIFITARE